VRQRHTERVNAAGCAWLSSATRDPVATRFAWSIDPGARQPADTGRLFDAVVIRAIPGADVLELLAETGAPAGAVISQRDGDKWAYLVGPGSAHAWRSAVGAAPGPGEAGWYRYVGHRGCLTVPGPLPHPDTSLRWVVPPGLDTNLTCLTSLATAFRLAVPSARAD
jgi:hypothetical protein